MSALVERHIPLDQLAERGGGLQGVEGGALTAAALLLGPPAEGAARDAAVDRLGLAPVAA